MAAKVPTKINAMDNAATSMKESRKLSPWEGLLALTGSLGMRMVFVKRIWLDAWFDMKRVGNRVVERVPYAICSLESLFRVSLHE